MLGGDGGPGRGPVCAGMCAGCGGWWEAVCGARREDREGGDDGGS